jgi:hypothetical protein
VVSVFGVGASQDDGVVAQGLTRVLAVAPSAQYAPATADLLARFPVTVHSGEQADLLVLLNARHLGTFSIGGIDVSWRGGDNSGVHYQPVGVTLYFDRSGPDPGMSYSPHRPVLTMQSSRAVYLKTEVRCGA